jgi:hypothetical protein
MMLYIATILTATTCLPPSQDPPFGSPSPENLDRYLDRILPSAREDSWKTEIEWVPGLLDGLKAASLTKRPLVLWTTAGEPLGHC